jgi:hypothetical protein
VTEDEIRVALAAGAKSAAFFEPVYPPRHSVNPKSFFGGRPNLPPEIDWPVNNIAVDFARGVSKSAPVASTFVGQIDLGELPNSLDISPLPKRGTLFFFFDSSRPGTGGTVIYSGHSGTSCPEREEPKDLRPCYGDNAEYHFQWLKHTNAQRSWHPASLFKRLKQAGPERPSYPRSFPKWAVRPFSCVTYGPAPRPVTAPDQKVDYKALNEIGLTARRIQDEQFAAAFPAAVERNYFCWEKAERGRWRGGPGFPHAWICVEIFAGTMLEEIREFREESLAEYARLRIGDLEREARNWLERSHSQGRYDALPDFAKAEFWNWFERVVETEGNHRSPRHWVGLQKCLAAAYRTGSRLCLSHSAAAAKAIPAAYVEDQRWQLAVNVSGHGGRYIRHRLLGATAHLEHDKPTKEHKLLMQFDSQEGLDWMWGDVGLIEYWIKPEDLEGLHFGDVFVTLRG